MINLPRDFQTARAYDGTSFPQITPGGHICRIRNVTTGMSSFDQREQLIVTYDIVEEGELNGYFQKIFDYRRRQSAEAKWPGVMWLNIANDDGTCDSRFKGFIESVEASNSGYKFTGDEKTLQGKLVGFNFREEEYMPRNSTTGEIKTTVKPFYAVSVAKVREGCVPPAKKLLNSNNRRGAAAAPSPGYGYTQAPPAPTVDAAAYDDDDDGLPF